MTLRDAIARRIPRIRKPQWSNQAAYLRLPLFADGSAGPWAELYDDMTQRDVLEVRPGSQRVLTVGCGAEDCGYEPYSGPVSPYEHDPQNFARVYVDA